MYLFALLVRAPFTTPNTAMVNFFLASASHHSPPAAQTGAINHIWGHFAITSHLPCFPARPLRQPEVRDNCSEAPDAHIWYRRRLALACLGASLGSNSDEEKQDASLCSSASASDASICAVFSATLQQPAHTDGTTPGDRPVCWQQSARKGRQQTNQPTYLVQLSAPAPVGVGRTVSRGGACKGGVLSRLQFLSRPGMVDGRW